ncbi:MAG: 50S ribosomal protein L10e [Candidatus Woesearchaeota archaeon]|nr:50S ribosomal protein L10e [Candidatus Woesearchaeota archaeon]
MARLRKGVSYRKVKRPYTRYSKFRKKSYIKATPNVIIAKFELGNKTGEFKVHAELISKKPVQIRQEAIEAARRTCNRYLERNVGKNNYHLKIKIYPFHILRENPIAKGAGADRFSTGMSHAFGKPAGIAAQVRKGQVLFLVRTSKEHVKATRKALKRANYKLPVSCSIQIKENK